MVVETPSTTLQAGILVAADGLASSLRRAAGLERASHAPRRFGLRQHFRVEPWSRSVEVHLSSGAEAYVTPAGNGRIGVAFLWEEGQATLPISVRTLLRRFPALESSLRGADADSTPIGAGPLARRATGMVSDRFALRLSERQQGTRPAAGRRRRVCGCDHRRGIVACVLSRGDAGCAAAPSAATERDPRISAPLPTGLRATLSPLCNRRPIGARLGTTTAPEALPVASACSSSARFRATGGLGLSVSGWERS